MKDFSNITIQQYIQVKMLAYKYAKDFNSMSTEQKLEFIKSNPFTDNEGLHYIFTTTLFFPNDLNFLYGWIKLKIHDSNLLSKKLKMPLNIVCGKQIEFSFFNLLEILEKRQIPTELSKQNYNNFVDQIDLQSLLNFKNDAKKLDKINF